MVRNEIAIEAALRTFPGSTLQRTWELKGGISAHSLAIELNLPGGDKKRLVARFPGDYVRTLFDNAAEQEFRTLNAISDMGLLSPKPISLETSDCGGFLLIEYLEGAPTAAPAYPESFLDQMAETLARIHQVDISGGRFDFLLPNKPTYTPPDREMDDELREADIVRALVNYGPPPIEYVVLRHGDFWPGNLLWQDGRLTGVIDWENALRGPAVADLAVSRLDVWWVLGKSGMESFTEKYLAKRPTDLTHLAYWELRATTRAMTALRDWAPPYAALERPDMTYEMMRDVLLEFVEEAFARLP